MNNRNPQYRAALLMGIIVVLALPFLAFVIYFGTHYPSGHWPNWFANTMLAWFAANFLIVAVAAKRIFKGAPANPEQAQAARAVWGAGYAWLLVVWILLFLLGTAATIAGKFLSSAEFPPGRSCCSSSLSLAGLCGTPGGRRRKRRPWAGAGRTNRFTSHANPP